MYFGEHSIRFYPDESRVGANLFKSENNPLDCPDTWERWHLIPTGKVIIQPPEYKQNLLEIPGRNGPVDVNKYTFGRPVYGARTGDIEFILDPDYIEDWPDIYSDMMRYFQGQERCAVLQDDRYYYYKGLFSVSELTPDESWDTVKLNYTLEPFKYERWTSAEPWLWDDFDFRQGVIRAYRDIDLNTLYPHAIEPHGILTIPMMAVPSTPEFMETNSGDSDYPAVVSGVIAACDALPDEEEAVSANFTTLKANLLTAKDTYLNNRFENPPLSTAVSMLAEVLDYLDTLKTSGDTEGIESTLPIMRACADDVRKHAIAGIAQGSVDGENWYNIYYENSGPEAGWVSVPELTLRGNEYPAYTAYLYLRGTGHVSIRLRGGTL